MRARLPPQTSRNPQRPHLPLSAVGSRSSRNRGRVAVERDGIVVAHVAGHERQEAGRHHLAAQLT
jgi:hypothetical protein